jgi:hypothetical protein
LSSFSPPPFSPPFLFLFLFLFLSLLPLFLARSALGRCQDGGRLDEKPTLERLEDHGLDQKPQQRKKEGKKERRRPREKHVAAAPSCRTRRDRGRDVPPRQSPCPQETRVGLHVRLEAQTRPLLPTGQAPPLVVVVAVAAADRTQESVRTAQTGRHEGGRGRPSQRRRRSPRRKRQLVRHHHHQGIHSHGTQRRRRNDHDNEHEARRRKHVWLLHFIGRGGPGMSSGPTRRALRRTGQVRFPFGETVPTDDREQNKKA